MTATAKPVKSPLASNQDGGDHIDRQGDQRDRPYDQPRADRRPVAASPHLAFAGVLVGGIGIAGIGHAGTMAAAVEGSGEVRGTTPGRSRRLCWCARSGVCDRPVEDTRVNPGSDGLSGRTSCVTCFLLIGRDFFHGLIHCGEQGLGGDRLGEVNVSARAPAGLDMFPHRIRCHHHNRNVPAG